jgi:hypothetical protein
MRKAYIILMKKLRQDMPFKKGGDINFPNNW